MQRQRHINLSLKRLYLRVIPDLDTGIIHRCCINPVLALDKIKASGKWLCVLDTKGFQLVIGQAKIGFQGGVKRIVLLDRKRPFYLQIIYHIKMVDEGFFYLPRPVLFQSQHSQLFSEHVHKSIQHSRVTGY